MITGRQIRAARGLLGWSAAELAERCGLTRESVNRIEDSSVTPREGTMADITRAFDAQRIEFLDNEGVRFRPEGVDVLNGRAGLARFFDAIYLHANTNQEEITIRQHGIEEGVFDRFAPMETTTHRTRMSALIQKRKNIFVRALLQNGDKNFLCTNYAEYKWSAKNTPPTVPYYLFGDVICIFALQADPPPKIIFITSPIIAQTYQDHFDRSWDVSLAPQQI